MAVWRRKALEVFPELREALNHRDYTIYQLFFDLLPLSRAAHETSNDSVLENIYSFAEWCLHQHSPEPANAAAVAFYEHLFDQRQYWHEIISHLSPFVIQQCRSLWENNRNIGDDEMLIKL